MKLSQILLFLFSFFSVLSILGVIIENENLFLISKTIIFPCILFYYFDKMNKINYLFLIILLIFYLVDIILILDIPNQIFYFTVLLNINHLIILGYSIKNIEKRQIEYKLLFFSIFMFLLGCSIQYLIYDLIKQQNFSAAIAIFLSGIFVSIFNGISLYNYLVRNSFICYYFGFACLSLGLMYACYDIYKYVYYIKILRILSLFFKIAAYFLFIKFILAKETYLLKKENNLQEII